MKKKILSLVLALLMAIPSAAFVAADDAAVTTETETTATEAAEPAPTAAVEDETAEDEESPYMYAVEFLAQYGIFKGYSADNPGIEDPIQRYQMALFVSRISTGWTDDEKWEDGSLNATPFYDVDVDPVNKYLGAISYANQKGIIEGVSAHHFEPQEGINYQDALTMLVRTLGWTGLKHPWGYIQKAVEIGLTEGIKDVAYTQELTRGEVAQLVYNALFIAGANGTKLALTQFGVEFGWETIIITASDRVKNDVSDKLATADGQKRNAYVAFRLFDETTGKATGDTYYALATALKLDATKNEDDAAVGHTYNVLFEKVSADATAKYGDSEIVNIVDMKSTYLTTVKNEGLTDDEGVARTTVNAIGEYLTDYTLVEKYTPAAYVGAAADKISGTNTRALAKEIMIYNANGLSPVVTGTDTRGIAIDFQTGDILVACKSDDADLKYTFKVGTTDYYYKVAWYYNATLDRYYRYVYPKDAAGKYQVGVNYMDDKEWADFYSKAVTIYEDTQALVVNTSKDVFKNAAYASLYLEDINYDGVADRGIYKTYHFGYLNAATTMSCGHSDLPAYKLTTFDPLMQWNGTNHDFKDNTYTVFSDPTNVHCKDYTDAAWFADSTYVPKTGYVVYSYNVKTHEIEVVKELGTYSSPLGTDKDSYVARGVLQAYSTTANTITITGQKPLTADYSTLGNAPVCNMGARGNDTEKARNEAYADGLYSMLEQFVEYVVVDGKIVHIQLVGTSSKELLVVKRYAGTTNDGYIAVDAYSTATGELGTYVIGSYNGWKQGDYYYFLTEEKVEESFTPGVIYQIKSHDEKEDLYYVETAGEFSAVTNTYTLAANGDYLTSIAGVTIKSVSDGYYDISWSADNDYVRKSSSDLFIFIPSQADASGTHTTAGSFRAPIYAYKGALPNGITIEGTRITSLNGSKQQDQHVYIFADVSAANMDTLYKTISIDAYQLNLYLYQGGRVLSAAYDSAAPLREGRWLLGATVSEVEVFDLYTGGTTTVKTDRNIDLQKGHIYAAVSGQIVEDISSTATRDDSGLEEDTLSYTAVSELLKTLAKYYPQSTSKDSGDKFKLGTFMLNVSAWLAADNNAKKADFMNDVIGGTAAGGLDLYTSTLIGEDGNPLKNSSGVIVGAPYTNDRDRIPEGGVTFHTVTISNAGYTWTMDAQTFSDWAKANKTVTAVGAGYVYDVAKATIVVYVDLSAGKTTTKVEEQTLEKDIELLTSTNSNIADADVKLMANITYTQYTVNGVISKVEVNSVTFKWTGIDGHFHHDLAEAGYHFGTLDQHTGETANEHNGLYDAALADEADTNHYNKWADLYSGRSNVVYTPCEDCDLVTAITITIKDGAVLDLLDAEGNLVTGASASKDDAVAALYAAANDDKTGKPNNDAYFVLWLNLDADDSASTGVSDKHNVQIGFHLTLTPTVDATKNDDGTWTAAVTKSELKTEKVDQQNWAGAPVVVEEVTGTVEGGK